MKKLLILFVMLIFSTSLYSKEWWKTSVFYEVFVRSFYDSDGDGKGDLKGLTEKLDYLNDGDPNTKTDLGVDALWLMPIFESPSYHGYDTVDYYKIDSDYGTMEDFETLLKEAHKRGIRIIVDFVINHTSTKHPWFIESANGNPKYEDFYIWSKELPEGKWGLPWGGGSPYTVWPINRTRKERYYAAFWQGMPDLNLKSTNVRAELKRIAKFWLDKGVDGYRLDAARYLIEEGPGKLQADTQSTFDWWVEFKSYIRSVKKDAVLVGEVWTGNQYVHKYYLDGKGLDLCFDFEFADQTQMTATYGSVNNIPRLIKRKSALSAPLSFYAPFLSNHDTLRCMNNFQKDFSSAKVAALILLTTPGTPFMYYGEEIGMFMGEGRRDEHKRTPMQWKAGAKVGFTSGDPWQAPTWDKAPFTVSDQEKSSDSLLNFYKSIIHIRRSNPEFSTTNISFLPVYRDTELKKKSSKVVAYLRTDGDSESLILINASKMKKSAYIPSIANKKWKNYLSGKNIVFKAEKTDFAAKEYMILKRIK